MFTRLVSRGLDISPYALDEFLLKSPRDLKQLTFFLAVSVYFETSVAAKLHISFNTRLATGNVVRAGLTMCSFFFSFFVDTVRASEYTASQRIENESQTVIRQRQER